MTPRDTYLNLRWLILPVWSIFRGRGLRSSSCGLCVGSWFSRVAVDAISSLMSVDSTAMWLGRGEEGHAYARTHDDVDFASKDGYIEKRIMIAKRYQSNGACVVWVYLGCGIGMCCATCCDNLSGSSSNFDSFSTRITVWSFVELWVSHAAHLLTDDGAVCVLVWRWN